MNAFSKIGVWLFAFGLSYMMAEVIIYVLCIAEALPKVMTWCMTIGAMVFISSWVTEDKKAPKEKVVEAEVVSAPPPPPPPPPGPTGPKGGKGRGPVDMLEISRRLAKKGIDNSKVTYDKKNKPAYYSATLKRYVAGSPKRGGLCAIELKDGSVVILNG